MRTKKDSIRGIKQISDGMYLIRVQRQDPKTGLPLDIRRKVKCASLREAIAEQSRLLEEASAGDKPEIPRLRDYAHSWLSGRRPMLKISTSTLYAETLELHVLPTLGAIYLDKLTPEDVQQWFADKATTRAPATVNGYLRVLKTLMADATERYDLARDPTRRIRAMPLRRMSALEADEPVNIMSDKEIGRFLATLKLRWPQWFALVFTQLSTARRFGEVSALKWDDINYERGIIIIRRAQWRTIVGTPKTDRIVTVPLTDELRTVLHDWRQEMLRTQHRHVHTGWIFPSKAGRPHHNASCMRKAFIDCLKVTGIERRFASHGLRRTANDLLRRVASGVVTRAITGHVTEGMTEHYSNVDPGEKLAAVNAALKPVMLEMQSAMAEQARDCGR